MNRALHLGLGTVLGLGAGWLLFGGAGIPTGGAGGSAGAVHTLETAQLRARVAELEQQLAENKIAAARDPAAIPMPEHVDPRFSPDKIRVAINDALKQAGLEGEATSVDCSEFPCLAIGEMKKTEWGPDQTTQVANILRTMGYSENASHGFGSSIEENGQKRFLFGLAIYQKSDDPDQEALIGKRLRYRFNVSQGME